jgi:ADP-ribosyl-[dinitrogen reductase] hydrolase
MDISPPPVDPTILRELARRDLLPRDAPGATRLPSGPAHAKATYRSRFRACLLAGAIGDALGRPAEGLPRESVERRFGPLTEFRSPPGRGTGPKGTITDDTQLTMCVAKTYVDRGCLDPEDLADRLVAWLPEGRGKGRTCTAAVRRLEAGTPWHEAGRESAGNGAAMRSAPVGLANPRSLARLQRDAALQAVITHADPMAVASSVALAFGVARLLHQESGALVPDRFVAEVVGALSNVPDPGHPERRPDAGPEPVRLAERIAEVPKLLGRSPEDAFSYLYNGAFVLESLPAAFWCFLRAPEDPESVLVTAADGGYDADTVASLAGNLSGAYLGEAALPERWLEELEFREKLRRLADGLLEVAGFPDA